MVGDVCDVDWLNEQLMRLNGGGSSTDGSMDGGTGGVMVLDCRSPADYHTSHIVGAVHLAVPTLMLRRLTTGNLPVSSVISCLQQCESSTCDQQCNDSRWRNETLVLHDECSHDVTDDVISCSTQPLTSCHVISVLLRRLKEGGFRVCLLNGGYSAFSRKYPQLCVTSLSRDDCNMADMSTVLGLHRLRLQQQQQQKGTSPSGDHRQYNGDEVPSPRSVDIASAFPVEVLPFLYLGNARSSSDVDALYRNGIKYILNVTPDVPNSFADSDQFHYLQIPINDHWTQNMAAFFPDAIAFIDEARRSRRGVLVHCLAGISRSVTVTVAYLMHTLDMSLNDAYDHVKRCKPDVSPNFSFMGQLMDYERSLRSSRYVDGSGRPPLLSCTDDCCEPCEVCRPQQQQQQQQDFLSANAASTADSQTRSRRCACATLSSASTGSDSLTCYSSPVSSLSSLSTSSAATSSSSASSSAFEYEIPSTHA